MSFEEKNTWVYGVVALVAYVAYAAVVLTRAHTVPLAQVAYVGPMLVSIGGAIIAGIIGRVAIVATNPKDGDRKDDRDREIYRFSEYVGQSFVVAGAVAAMGMAMARIDQFWIANAIYLAFVLSALLSSVTRIVAYRRGFQSC